MSDAADQAFDLETAHLAASLRRIDAAMPTGVAGECDECGEIMPRLVGGRCGFCRDGRRPPLSLFDDSPPPVAMSIADTAPAAPAEVFTQEETTMPTPKPTATSRTISVPASDAILKAIEQRAAEEDLPLGRAVVSLLEDALARPTLTAPVEEESEEVLLSRFSSEALLRQIEKRLSDTVERHSYTQALSRAVAAEQQLAAIRSAVANIGAEG
ncbi:MAG: hypothetical protein V3V60_15820 [Sphingomonas aquatilis]|uniref:hypothetical protein n=1 Tax=Sphingomonas aquatilis TaxID=93063 RepID=UPI002F2DE19E